MWAVLRQAIAMIECPERVRHLVVALGKLPPQLRPCGLLYEDALGEVLPEEVASWTRTIRSAMDEVLPCLVLCAAPSGAWM